MNTAQNKQVTEALGELPKGFDYGFDFVNWNNPGYLPSSWVQIRTARVVRVWGKARHLVLFDYSKPIHDGYKGTAGALSRGNYGLLFLNTDGDLIPFDPQAIETAWRIAQGKGDWAIVPDRVVEEYLRDHGARPFTGRGWAAEIASQIHNLIPRWESHYNVNLHKVGQ